MCLCTPASFALFPFFPSVYTIAFAASCRSMHPSSSACSPSLPPSFPSFLPFFLPSSLPADHWGIEAGLSTSGSSSSNLRRPSYQYGGSGRSPSPSITNKQVLCGFVALGLIFCTWREGREGGRGGWRERGKKETGEARVLSRFPALFMAST